MAPTFAEDDDKSEHCARCMPVRVLDRPKIIEQPAEAFTPDLDIFSLAKDSNGKRFARFSSYKFLFSRISHTGR